MSREIPAREETIGPSSPVLSEQEDARAADERRKPHACDAPQMESFLFDDPYWDDAFDSYYNPTLRTCCRL